jgi:twitching motility two-component system response regulator PilG
VNGVRSLIDIAEQLDQDLLELARSYMAWATSGWVTFREDAPTTQVVMATQKPRPMVLSIDDSVVVQTMIKRALGDRYHENGARSQNKLTSCTMRSEWNSGAIQTKSACAD